MKYIYSLLITASLLVAGNNAIAADGVSTLDLTKPLNPETLTFGEDGAWDKLYVGNEDNSQDFFEAQIFIMSHMASFGGTYWEGFAPCTSTVMSDNSSFTVGCMAGGGIAIDENNNVVTDENNNATIDASMPYLVGYYTNFYNERSCQILFNDGLAHELVGVYVTNFPTSFYNCLYGNGFARAFVNGDEFTLTIHGVATDGSEKTIDVAMAKYENDTFQAIRGWKYIDLSSLGAVESLYFTMSSTDSGSFGSNTSTYFCLDKLMVKTEGETSGISEASLDEANKITYDRATAEVVLPQSVFAVIYNAAGQKVMATEGQRIAVGNLDKGIYLVRTATGGSLRFIR